VATQMRLADKQAELRHLERDVTRRERELTVKDAEVDRCGAELEELRELFNMP
jgi:predicted Zn-ribbon and HTH transcriptional regulator